MFPVRRTDVPAGAQRGCHRLRRPRLHHSRLPGQGTRGHDAARRHRLRIWAGRLASGVRLPTRLAPRTVR
jgi:hypothetical protein